MGRRMPDVDSRAIDTLLRLMCQIMQRNNMLEFIHTKWTGEQYLYEAFPDQGIVLISPYGHTLTKEVGQLLRRVKELETQDPGKQTKPRKRKSAK